MMIRRGWVGIADKKGDRACWKRGKEKGKCKRGSMDMV